MIVCDAEKLECMVHRCNDCATSSSLHEHVTAKLEEYEITDDIDFSQWDSTDRTTLRTYTSPVEEFVDMLLTMDHSMLDQLAQRYDFKV